MHFTRVLASLELALGEFTRQGRRHPPLAVGLPQTLVPGFCPELSEDRVSLQIPMLTETRMSRMTSF